MALFTDGAVSRIEDLIAYESSVLELAATEQIDLTVKLNLAHDELGIELEAMLAGRQGTTGLANIVVTGPLRKWHVFHTLALIHRDAYYRQLNDRYQGKWKEYEKLAARAREALLQTGLGVVFDPIPRAEKPELSYIPAAGVGAATYYVRAAWRNTRGEEGSPSEVATLSVPSGNTLVVKPVRPPACAAGWNVYVGFSAQEQTLQNASPLRVNETWTAPATGLVQGALPGNGQEPQTILRTGRTLLRG
ncbi:MAG TPA: hypothetical protein PLA43_18875 [Bryobacteraceae bacterium]|nr:hypothetical protein [Bryobacteraceae bacterium]HOQ46194.1 hypothetical protein [Bryobacteraceae bacterium]HPQ14372.1 hypothetical protein [Bryobacteraceae bacterium]HPU74023.1 hypothetical protein [Bryobacteraceae bacterium]